jgi:hypothetical protein
MFSDNTMPPLSRGLKFGLTEAGNALAHPGERDLNNGNDVVRQGSNRSCAFGHESAVWRNYRTRACQSLNPSWARSRWTGLAGGETSAPARLGASSAGFLVSVRLVDSPAKAQSKRAAEAVAIASDGPDHQKRGDGSNGYNSLITNTAACAPVPPGLATTRRPPLAPRCSVIQVGFVHTTLRYRMTFSSESEASSRKR